LLFLIAGHIPDMKRGKLWYMESMCFTTCMAKWELLVGPIKLGPMTTNTA